MTEVIITYFHYISFIVLFAALVMEHMLFKPTVDSHTAKRLASVDAIVGISAAIVLLTGLLKVFMVGKPAAYYMHTWIFHVKLTVFVVVALLSIFPTIKFIQNRNTPEGSNATYPAVIKHILRLEMALFLLLPLLGVLMARGYGYFE